MGTDESMGYECEYEYDFFSVFATFLSQYYSTGNSVRNE